MLGLYHMSGNVAEWEDSCTLDGQCRVRGGAFSTDNEDGLRCDADVLWPRDDDTHNDVGFRCCL
jgi:formylglycine-generating enzyme required for sulfatase activity